MRWIQGTGPGTPIGIPWEAVGASAFNMQHSLEWMFKEMLDGSLKPVLAESWDVDTKAPSLTFHLRKGVKFHDGTDFNAAAVKWNLEKEMDPASTNYGSTTNWKSIEAVDTYTLRVNLKTWQNTALGTFASMATTVISPTAFDKQGIDALRWKMVGTGPFVQTDFQRDVVLSFVKNPNYWQQGLPYVDKLQIIYSTELLTCAALLKSGGADILNCQGSIVTANDVQAAGFKIVSQPAGTGGLGNLTPDSINADSPWSNVKVRMAAEYALDKESMAKTFGMGYAVPAYQICAPSSPGNDPRLTPRKYDPTKARQLLAEAGYPEGFPLSLSSSYQAEREAGIIAAEWEKIGVRTKVTILPLSEIGSKLAAPKGNGFEFDVVANLAPDLMAHVSFLAGICFYSGSPLSRLNDPEFDALYEKISSAIDPSVQLAAAKQLDALIYREAWGIFTYQKIKNYAMKRELQIPISQNGILDLRDAAWKR